MKLFFKITDTSDALAVAALSTIELQINNTWHKLEKIASLVKDVVFAKVTTNIQGVWLTISKRIQGVRYTTALAVLTPVTPETLTDNDEDAFSEIVDITINEFEAGKSYLIPYTAGPVTRIMPQATMYGIDTVTDTVFNASHYLFNCSKTEQVRNGSGFTGSMLTFNVRSIANNEKTAILKDAQHSANFANSL